jgi:hypothetical protein
MCASSVNSDPHGAILINEGTHKKLFPPVLTPVVHMRFAGRIQHAGALPSFGLRGTCPRAAARRDRRGRVEASAHEPTTGGAAGRWPGLMYSVMYRKG